MNKQQYKHNTEICKQLQPFKAYLQRQGNSENTIRQKSNYAGNYIAWLEQERIIIHEARYNDVVAFIDYCTQEGNSKKHINSKLRSIRQFYEYLKSEETTQKTITVNPATNLYIRGIRQKTIHDIIDISYLEALYHNYTTGNPREQRNKIILGLLIFQGLTTQELHVLEPCHLQLKAGKITIPGNNRRNSRILDLKPFQILEIHQYITTVRTLIINQIHKPKPARKPNKINQEQIEQQLFISINGSENIKNSLFQLFKAIQKQQPDIQNPKQIRASVITNWLKTNNLRQVQYMAGHKYVSSTERYQTNNLESLQVKLELLHPLNRH